PHRRLRLGPGVLGDRRHAWRDALCGARRVGPLTEEVELAAAHPDDPEDRLERRALARGVTAQQADHLARVNDHVDLAQDLYRPVVGVGPLELEDGLATGADGRPAPSSGRTSVRARGPEMVAHEPASAPSSASSPATASSITSFEARLPRYASMTSGCSTTAW